MDSLQQVFGVNGASGKPLHLCPNSQRLYNSCHLVSARERAMRPQCLVLRSVRI